jgi:hypothetical protein
MLLERRRTMVRRLLHFGAFRSRLARWAIELVAAGLVGICLPFLRWPFDGKRN